MALSMMLPIACQNLIAIAVNAMDMAMLSRIGETAVSAASLAGQYVNIFQIFCLGIGTGASVLTARFWGMKEITSLRVAITIMLRIVLVVACIFAAVSFFFPYKIMSSYTTNSAIVSEGALYLEYAVPSFFFHGLSQTSAIILRSIRKVKISLFASLGAFFLNIAGNYFLIFGKCGFPAMGIAGASLATTIARFVECVFVLGYLLVVDEKIEYRLSHFFMKTKGLVYEYIKITLPVLVSDGMLAFGNNTIMVIIGHMGDGYVAAYAVVAIIERLCTAWSSGVAHSSSVIIGNSLGEGKVVETTKKSWAFLGLGIVIGVIGSLIILCAKNPIIALYNLQPETAKIVGQFILASTYIVIFQSIGSILTKGILRGGGDTKVLMVVDNIFLWGLSIPLGYVLGVKARCAPIIVYSTLNMHHFCKSIWSIFRVKKGNWMHKIKSATI